MRAAADVEEYSQDPEGSYLALPGAITFCARRTLWGFALWGRPTETDLRRVVPLLALELADGVAPHASLIDTRRLEAADPRAFKILQKYLRTNWETLRTRITRLALVRPPGLLGATVAGFYEVAGAPYPVRVFDELAAAAAWVRGADLAAVLDAAVAAASALTPVVLELRRWLDGHLEDASLAGAAKAVARAPRSLQRDLEAAGTSFQGEIDAARVRLAKRLLADTDSPLTEIAYDIGCASPQHFSTLFRRVTGAAPSAFRASRRRRG
ncbi:MAG: helix-turn-helix transcriptional regulator [Kofleriaceae bacterium]